MSSCETDVEERQDALPNEPLLYVVILSLAALVPLLSLLFKSFLIPKPVLSSSCSSIFIFMSLYPGQVLAAFGMLQLLSFLLPLAFFALTRFRTFSRFCEFELLAQLDLISSQQYQYLQKLLLRRRIA